MLVVFTISLLQGTEEILGCAEWGSENFRGFCVLLTEVKPLVKESEEATLGRGWLWYFTVTLLIFSVSSCSTLWPSFGPKVTPLAIFSLFHCQLLNKTGNFQLWFSFLSCGSNPRERSIPCSWELTQLLQFLRIFWYKHGLNHTTDSCV